MPNNVQPCQQFPKSSRPSLRRIVCVALFAWMSSFTAAAFADTPAQRYGVVSDWDSNVAAKFSDLGIGLLRTPCNWVDMEPSRGDYAFERGGGCDYRISGATANGYQVLMTIGCTPVWAGSGGDCNAAPSDWNDWYDFVAHFVSYYSGKNVVLGIYNEPDISTDGTAMWPSQYCGFAITAMQARDSVNTGFPLGLPETSDGAYGNGWFSDALSCIRQYATLRAQDVITVHWYNGGPAMTTYLDYVFAYSGGGNNVWLSETGFGAADQSAQANFYNARLLEFEYWAVSGLDPVSWTV